MTVACLIAGTGTVCLAAKMAPYTVPSTIVGPLQNLSVSVFELFLRLIQLR